MIVTRHRCPHSSPNKQTQASVRKSSFWSSNHKLLVLSCSRSHDLGRGRSRKPSPRLTFSPVGLSGQKTMRPCPWRPSKPSPRCWRWYSRYFLYEASTKLVKCCAVVLALCSDWSWDFGSKNLGFVSLFYQHSAARWQGNVPRQNFES